MRTLSSGLSSTTCFLDQFGRSCIVARCLGGLIFSAGAFFFAVSWAIPSTPFVRERSSTISREGTLVTLQTPFFKLQFWMALLNIWVNLPEEQMGSAETC